MDFKQTLIPLTIFMSGCGPMDAPPAIVKYDTCYVQPVSAGSLITCPDGSESVVTNGTDGLPGTNGSNGLPGTNGIDATPVTTVKFCDGTPSYPSTFIEYGICLNGAIYGVYSANGGFLAYFPPGTYSSSAINSRCTFTIHLNCAVTR